MFIRDVFARRLRRLGPALAALLFAAACSNGAPPPSLARVPAGTSTLSAPIYSEGFEAGLDGWTAQTTGGVATWHVQTHPENVSVTSALNPFAVTLPDNGAHLPAVGGTNVAWFGDDSTGSYIGADYPSTQTAKGGGTSKEAQSGNLTSPPISLVGVTKALLEFDSWWEIEGVAGQSYDVMTVQASKDNGTTWTNVGTLNPTFATNQPGYAAYSSGGPAATPQWRHYGYDLSSYAGQSVLVRFRFDTRDAQYNGFRGWTVDNVAMSGGTTLPAPTLSAVSPTIATAGDVVHVTGTNFFQGATFFLGTTQIASGSITQFGVNEMIFKAPTLTPGTYDVKVVNPDGQTATLLAAFTYAATASPTVSSVSPSSAQINTAQSVTLTGTNFAAGATVNFGSTAATSVTVVSATQITAQVPALGAGTYNITVTLPSGQSGTGYSLYTVADKSTLAMTSPSGGESWASGSTHNLTWSSTIATVVSLDLYRSGGFVQNIAASIPATPGSYAWTIPATLTLGGGYAIRISNPQGTTNATSAGTFTIAPASVATSVALAASSTAVVGQSISFTATLTPVASTGSVQFTVDGAALGAPVAVSGGTATSPATSWAGAGSHTVVAAFTGSGTFSNSSAQITETVGAAATSSSVTSSGPGAYGQSVTFTASVAAVAPGAGTPAGTVQFFDGATSLGTATLSGGTASLPVSTLSVGSHDITVQYGGSADFTASTSPSGALTETVSPGPASLSATFSPAAPVNGQPVTVTVFATGGGGFSPTGQVTIQDGGVALGTVTLADGTATFTFAFGAGAHSFVLSYAGDANYAPSDQSGGSLIVAAASTALSLSSSGSGTYGQPVTFTALVSTLAPGAGSPDGTVTFFADGAQLGTAAVGSGTASFSTSALQVGSHAMTATYGGSPSFVTSGGSMTESVAVGNAPTVVTVSPAAPVFGQPVVLTIAVNAAGTGAAATGTVTVLDGAVVLQTLTLSSSGATFTTTALSVGSHSLTVSYSGDANYGASTSSAAVLVGKAGSGLAFSAAPSSAVSGQSVTLTATLTAVAPGAGTPQGSVDFSDGATSLGSAVLSGGVATLNVSTFAVGTHALTASFAGSGSFNGSSGSASATIAQGATSVSLTASTGASTYGSPVTLTCAVSAIAPATGTPSGTVTFLDGTTVLGTGTLDASGTASFTLSSLGAGAHSLTASYAGDTGFAAAATSGATSLSVAKAAASLALSASAPTAVAGQTVTFTLAATSPGGVPGGTASLFDGSTALGNGSLDGSGSLTVTASFHAGTHALRAVYAGSANFVAAPDASIAYAVDKAATALSLQGPAASTWVNRPVTFVAQATATAPGSGLPAGTVTFSDGATVLGTAALDGSGSASFTVPSLTSGSHPIAASYAGSADFLGSSGTLAGGQAIQKSDPVAGSGTAVALDGSTQAVSVAANPALDGARTVELWFRAAASAASAPGPACLAQQGSGANLRFGLCLTAARDGFEIRRGADRQTIPAAVSSSWHHVALVDEENSTVLVLDGVAVGTVNGGFAPATGQPLVLGAAQAPAGGSARSDFFGGQLDELRLWAVPRTAQDLAAARQQPQTGQEQGLTALWRMDEGQGAQLYDAGAAHLVATLESSTASSFVPSTAWSQRTTPEERAMASFVAGYDPDGAPVTAVLVAQPAGVATASAASISYSPPRQFTGKDAFTYQVGSGPLGRFSVEVEVTHIDQCQAQLDCAGGDVCTNGRCMAPDSLHTLSGGCSTTPDSSSFALLPLVLVAGFLAMRRRARA